MSTRLIRFSIAWLTATPLFAQAAVEYALKSGQGAMAASGDSGIAGCRVDSALLSCLGRAYPRTAIVVAVVIGLMALRWATRVVGYRR